MPVCGRSLVRRSDASAEARVRWSERSRPHEEDVVDKVFVADKLVSDDDDKVFLTSCTMKRCSDERIVNARSEPQNINNIMTEFSTLTVINLKINYRYLLCWLQ